MSRERTLRPPIAKKVPKEIVSHGEKRVDNYFWMRNRDDPDLMKHIEAENQYAKVMMKRVEPLQDRLFQEMKGRLIETDSTVPESYGGYSYYSRTEAGRQYEILCRRKEAPESPEEILLDCNALSEGESYFRLREPKISDNQQLLVFLVDRNGSERYELRIKNLLTGELLPDKIQNTFNVEWANDNKTVYYSVVNESFRPSRVFKHVLGTDPSNDVLVYEEKDPRYYGMNIEKSKTRAYIFITVECATTSEVLYVNAQRPKSKFKVFCPRKQGVSYFVIHHWDKFFIVTNEDAVNFKLMQTPISSPSKENWKEVLPHRDSAVIDVNDPYAWVEAFEDYLVVYEHENALMGIRVISLKDGTSHTIMLPEPLCTVQPVFLKEFETSKMRFKYSSMVTPWRVYEYDMDTRTLEMKKKDEIPGYDPSLYLSERIYAQAQDGTKIPISLVHKKGLQKDGTNPALLYGYGAYGDFEGSSAVFERNVISLLERGFIYAVAHIRGGGDAGRQWHMKGRMMNKMNSFTDFVACAQHLVDEKYTSKEKLAIRGASAGGLLMGASTNLAPDLFRVVIAEVPFVDGVNSMEDPSMPLTAGEFEEWGNPLENKEHYDYIKKYSPYDNIQPKAYPNILATGGMNDTRVLYWEPLKWVAKLRETKTDTNLVLVKINMGQGHAGSSGRYDALKDEAFVYSFIVDRMGISG